MQGMNVSNFWNSMLMDMAPEGDTSAVHRREAASQLLNELDEQAKRQAVMDELEGEAAP